MMKKILCLMLLTLLTPSLWAQYNPDNPGDPGNSYTLVLAASPVAGGMVTPDVQTQLKEGDRITCTATANVGFHFVSWMAGDEIVSNDSSFEYVMPAKDIVLTAVFKWNPENPADPNDRGYSHWINLNALPIAGGYFTENSLSVVEGDTVYVQAYANAGYILKAWQRDGETISTENPLEVVMGSEDINLTATFTYAPDSPGDPMPEEITDSVPAPVIERNGNMIGMHVPFDDAIIYYTMDGKNPDSTSTVYNDSIEVSRNGIIKAIAVHPVLHASKVATFEVNWFRVANVEFAKDGNQVALSTTTENATIYYTISNSGTGEQIYVDALTLNADCTIEAWATREGYTTSDITRYNFIYTPAVAEPYAVLTTDMTSVLSSDSMGVTYGKTLTFYYDEKKTERNGMSVGPFGSTNDGANERAWNNARQSITSVVIDSTFAQYDGLTSTAYWFANFNNLTDISGLNYLNMANVTFATDMFRGCTSLTSLDLSSWSVPNLGDMGSMFYDCTALITLDLSNWHPIKAGYMNFMFGNCINLRTIYVNDEWVLPNDGSLTGWQYLFSNSESLVGGRGTTYNPDHIDSGYAHIDGGPSNPGYFTDKNASVLIASPVILIDGNIISIETNTTGANIYYTLDGSKPTKESTYYVEPIALTQNCCVRAIATMEGLTDSEESVLEVSGITKNLILPTPVISHEEDLFMIAVPSISEDDTDETSKVAVDPASWGGAADLPVELIPLSYFNSCANGSIPEGFRLFADNMEERVAGGNYSAGGRLFNDFAVGGDFTSALYMRTNYLTYGLNDDDHKLSMEAGKTYTLTFNTARWKSSGDFLKVLFLDAVGNELLSRTVTCNPDVNGSKNAVNGSSAYSIDFTPENAGDYELRFVVAKNADGEDAGEEWHELLLANVKLVYFNNTENILVTDDEREAVVAIVDEGGSEKTGELLQQSVTGLANGYYTVELYAKSVYSSAQSMAADVTYLFANDTKLFIPVEADKEIHEHNVYQIGVEVMDGTLRLGLGKDKTGANWHALQIKSLTRHALNTAQPIENATIYYTTDNSTPTTTSTRYTSPFEITKNCTIKAIAVAQGYSVSDVASFIVDWNVNATFDSNGVLAVGGSTTMTDALEHVGGRDEVAKTITAIVWNSSAALTNSDLTGISNPNMLIYVPSESQAPQNRDNVVIGNDSTGYTAKNIVLSDVVEGNGNFYCPKEFTAEMISYTHEYRQTTEVGVSRGWETIAMPFNVETVMHEKQGLIAPFGNSTSRKHFWLRHISTAGQTHSLAQATTIEANMPYLISMPNSDAYPDEYNLAGRVTFSSQNVPVMVTDIFPVHMSNGNGGMLMFVPCFQTQQVHEMVYALNVGEARDGYPEGSVFEANYREIRPFEAFTVHEGNSPAPQFIPVSDFVNSNLTGIEELRFEDVNDDQWYDLNGRKLQKKPTQKGVYLLNGRKVVMR